MDSMDRLTYTNRIALLEDIIAKKQVEIASISGEVSVTNEKLLWANRAAMHYKNYATKLQELSKALREQPENPALIKTIDRLHTLLPEVGDISIVKETGRPGALGRIPAPDIRDKQFLMAAPPKQLDLEQPFRYWWPHGWTGDQGWNPWCVAYAWLHLLEDGPVTQPPRTPGVGPILDPYVLYREAQRNDEWAGENYDGTSVRAGAKVTQREDLISDYIWIDTFEKLKHYVMTKGPVVVGTWWYDGMDWPDEKDMIRVTGRPRGGHAYLVNGMNLDRKVARIKNSWGLPWGQDGMAYISFDDLERLIIYEGGEACFPSEVYRAAA